MIEQIINGYTVTIKTADELGGFPITGESDIGIIEVYDFNKSEDAIDTQWISIGKDGLVCLER